MIRRRNELFDGDVLLLLVSIYLIEVIRELDFENLEGVVVV
jgi:hypothetical protein